MPPKAKITKEMIISAGLEIIRRNGDSGLNVRTVAKELGCSTQPVMYLFPTVEELKNELYKKADEYHSEYIMNTDHEDPLLGIGLRYIRFSWEEKNLFRFLFQSDKLSDNDFTQLLSSDELTPIFDILKKEAELTEEECSKAFAALFFTVHGIAGLLANNSMEYNEEFFAETLTNVFFGAIGAMKGGTI